MSQLIFSIMLLIAWPNLDVSLTANIMGQPAVVMPVSPAGNPTFPERQQLRRVMSSQVFAGQGSGFRQAARQHDAKTRVSIQGLNP